MSLKSKLKRNKIKWEAKLKEQQKRRDTLKKEMFGFPNLSTPLSLTTFLPVFLPLSILSRFYDTTHSLQIVSDLWSLGGIASTIYLINLGNQWFSKYGEQSIVKQEIPWKKINILFYFVCVAILIAIGFFLNQETFYLYMLSITAICIWLSLHKDAILWDMPPTRILGFRKYEFVPNHEDAHAIRNHTYKCVLKDYKKIDASDSLDGTYMGNGWFYLRKNNEE